MSKNVAIFVDVANLYYAARGQDVDVDYVALLKHATKGRDLIRAYAYSGLDPENENQRKFIDFLGKNGYRVVVKDIRKFGDGRVKANLDIELVVDLFRLRDRMDIAVIVSGDGDFAPAIRALQDEGVRCEVISFRPNTSGDLIAVADEFIDIMKIAGIGRKKDEKGAPPTPEMPAKEVVPEFGFREASPAVAAAALAALKGRGNGNGARSAERAEAAAENGRRRRRRRGGRGRKRAEGAPSGEATAEAAAAEPAWEEFDGLSEVQALEELGAEVGEEFDPDREYGFEEADEETLRELGLLDARPRRPAVAPAPTAGEADASTAPPPAAPIAPPDAEGDATTPSRRSRGGRRRRSATDADEAPVQAVTEAATAEPAAGADSTAEALAAPPRRRAGRRRTATAGTTAAAEEPDVSEVRTTRRRAPRRATPTASDEGAAEAGTAVASSEAPARKSSAKPRRRRTSSSSPEAAERAEPATASASEPDAGEGAQGIWQRFRSARQRPKTS